tara:strand:+ start:180 stop:596 length:417 start_codon:yes stop_codon:yes gene_type:complete
MVYLMNFFLTLVKAFVNFSINSATRHWITQRVSSLVLIPLSFLFIFPFAQHLALDYPEVINIYRKPERSLVAFLFLSITAIHFKQGAEVVIEDYIHDKRINKVLLLLNRIVWWILVCFLGFTFLKLTFFINGVTHELL